MAAGCCIVASATAPVQEVLEHGRSALLVDFFDPEAQAQAMAGLLADPGQRRQLAREAQRGAAAYSDQCGLEAWLALVEQGLCVDADQSAPALGAGTGNQV